METVRAFTVDNGSVTQPKYMQREVQFFLVALACVCGLALSASASTVSQVRTQCEIKRIAKACFETGFTELQFKDAKHRKSAVHFLKLACSIQKRAPCTKSENKIAARAYYNSPGRAPIQMMAKAPVVAPKIATTGRSTSFSSSAPPQAPENRAPLEPLHPPPPPPPQPDMAPLPMVDTSVGVPQLPMAASACMANDPSCAYQSPPPQ